MESEQNGLVEPRAKRQKKNHNKSAFERLKQLKGKGSKHKYEVNDIENVYEVVDEKEYSKNVLDRQDDDWIVDDDGSGYVEDGREIFDDDLDSESIASASKSTESRRKRKNISRNAGKGNIQALLSNMPEKKKEIVNLDQDDILSDVLSGMDDNLSSGPSSKNKFTMRNSEEQEAKNYMNNFTVPRPVKVKMNNAIKPKPVKSVEIFKELPVENNTIEDNLDISNDISENHEPTTEMTEDNTKQINPCSDLDFDDEIFSNFEESNEKSKGMDFEEEVKEKELLVEEDGHIQKESSNEETDELMDKWCDEFNFENIENVKEETEFKKFDNSHIPLTKTDDGEVFRFFWWDAFEDHVKQPGVVFLFGKTYVESVKSHVSCCVIIRNIERKVYVLPRPFVVDKFGNETDTPVKMMDVYKEFNEDIAEKMGLRQFRSRKVSKKYAFDPDVPLQSDYLEVRYTGSRIDAEAKGKTFSRIFGTNTTSLEIFLLESKIKGPCWLEIRNPKQSNKNLSWCHIEVECFNPSDVVIPENKKMAPPPLVVATLSIRTALSSNLKDNEIVMIGCLVHNQYHVDKQPPNPPFQKHFCVFTKPSTQPLPLDITAAIKRYKGTQLEKCDSEKALLNTFLNKFGVIDADLVVGHDLIDFHFNTLCERILKHKTTQWSRFGKLKRILVPKKQQSRDLMIGRLVCDLKISARELIKSRSYDLDTLCQNVLKVKEGERPVLESTDIVRMFNDSGLVIKLINLTMQDANYITKMMYELNVMPLALQITCIAGNVMSKTLQGGRAQRNEFLLLHAFYEKDYICPDKFNKAYSENEKSTSARKKPTYSGGLVLDPKVGFYDRLILLMDFNSLYPSIIQEYNICFTTMQSNLEPEFMLQSVSSEPGILPAEIRKLVESRRSVKKLMANSDISNDLKMQYNIRQLALKLTANSMYGCLGFQNSRFHAKHLASLVTLKGRDILMHTRDLVQGMGYEVIYGDTDSIMINTNIIDFDQVFKIGNNIKQAVNKYYKQVELDIDGVFKYMLLLKKKKYAAVTVSKNKKGEITLQQEHKGLDIVRRDWSMLASEVGKMVLNHILSDQSQDERIENVQGVLAKVANDLREGNVPITLLVITKQLTKNPNLYTDKVPLSHVLVALRYNKKIGKPLGQGDTVSYVICEDDTNNSATQRAYHIEELKRSETLKIDVNYYLAQQIHPVVSRLCEPIEGLDAFQIANFLGIDSTAFKSKPKPAEVENVIISAPAKKFRHAKSFEFICLDCKQTNSVNSLHASNGVLWLEKCANSNCKVRPIEYLYSIENRFTMDIQDFVELYYEKTLICEDPCCPNETSAVPLKLIGKYPVCDLCNAGLMYKKYPESELYEQICFYKHICDTSKLDKKTIHPDMEAAYHKLRGNVDFFLKKSAYAVVDLTALYNKIALKSTNENAEIQFEYDSDYDPEPDD